MINDITALCKKGKLKEAAELMHAQENSLGLDAEASSDLIVLIGKLSDLEKQEKRRRVNPQQAMDIRTGFAYELEDIIEQIKARPASPAAQPSNSDISPSTAPTHATQPNINNDVNISININIENIITTEVKNDIQALDLSLDELQRAFAVPGTSIPTETTDELEALRLELAAMKSAKNKDELPPYLNKVKSFFDKIEQGSSVASKALSATKDTALVLQNIGKHYNSIAQWVGLPQVPGFLL